MTRSRRTLLGTAASVVILLLGLLPAALAAQPKACPLPTPPGGTTNKCVLVDVSAIVNGSPTHTVLTNTTYTFRVSATDEASNQSLGSVDFTPCFAGVSVTPSALPQGTVTYDAAHNVIQVRNWGVSSGGQGSFTYQATTPSTPGDCTAGPNSWQQANQHNSSPSNWFGEDPKSNETITVNEPPPPAGPDVSVAFVDQDTGTAGDQGCNPNPVTAGSTNTTHCLVRVTNSQSSSGPASGTLTYSQTGGTVKATNCGAAPSSTSCTFSDLAPGASFDKTFDVSPAGTTNIVSTATVTSTNDPNAGNNTASQTTTVQQVTANQINTWISPTGGTGTDCSVVGATPADNTCFSVVFPGGSNGFVYKAFELAPPLCSGVQPIGNAIDFGDFGTFGLPAGAIIHILMDYDRTVAQLGIKAMCYNKNDGTGDHIMLLCSVAAPPCDNGTKTVHGDDTEDDSSWNPVDGKFMGLPPI